MGAAPKHRQVAKHRACIHACQLIGVAHELHLGVGMHRREQTVHQGAGEH